MTHFFSAIFYRHPPKKIDDSIGRFRGPPIGPSRLHYNLGVAYSAQKRHHEAQGAYETAIAKSPNTPCLGVIFSGSNGYMLLKFEKKKHLKKENTEMSWT